MESKKGPKQSTRKEAIVYESLTREEQLKTTAKWTRPNVFPTAVAFPYQKMPRDFGSILKTELFLGKRLTGSGLGHYQCHHGGILDPKDVNPISAAQRELLEETGFDRPEHAFEPLGIVGPEFYRGTMSIEGRSIVLTVGNEPANPKHPYLFNVFAVDVSGFSNVDTPDEEVELLGWITIEKLIEKYGQSLTFNYWTLVFMFLRQCIRTPTASLYPTFHAGSQHR